MLPTTFLGNQKQPLIQLLGGCLSNQPWGVLPPFDQKPHLVAPKSSSCRAEGLFTWIRTSPDPLLLWQVEGHLLLLMAEIPNNHLGSIKPYK